MLIHSWDRLKEAHRPPCSMVGIWNPAMFAIFPPVVGCACFRGSIYRDTIYVGASEIEANKSLYARLCGACGIALPDPPLFALQRGNIPKHGPKAPAAPANADFKRAARGHSPLRWRNSAAATTKAPQYRRTHRSSRSEGVCSATSRRGGQAGGLAYFGPQGRERTSRALPPTSGRTSRARSRSCYSLGTRHKT